ncbi:hypothetical protein GCM10010168_26330 [Actinoplanes ianthinogenes]|uniref:Transcriptional regulator n=1 Tax=Actinoplanes ianthinogenes TaxID=122358 RepID=A0ABM7M9C6_9ACTN|nr:hypothetical protein [Actinoplanes ianthinogenes]BCJ48273.1 hypothetical protein Aiant_89300 [Actinoplanes ianthinogenes]GGR07610.1 hypothetical protein GCM10010168_26330 [Actinoplanes ianthinogenes]
MAGTGPPNDVLAQCLAELRWTPRTLARRINAVYGPGTISESAPYHWRDRGRVPYPPVALYAVRVLADALGRPIAAEELWTAGQRLPDVARAFLRPRPGGQSAPDDPDAGLELVTVAERGVDALRGAAAGSDSLDALGYVAAQYQATRELLEQDHRGERLNRRLTVVAAQLAQLAAWLAMDAGRHRESQRYLVVGLRAAHEGGDRRLVAHLLRDLSANVAVAGRPADAVDIGQAALEAAAGTTATRSFAAGQLAYAHALAGDERSARRVADRATAMAAAPAGDEPEWVRRVAADTAEPMAARTLLRLARDELVRGRRARARTLVREGTAMLRPATLVAPGHPRPRAAIYEGLYLADGYVTAGEPEQACVVGRVVIDRLEQVRSRRAVSLVRDLLTDLRRGGRHRGVRDFIAHAEARLSTM